MVPDDAGWGYAKGITPKIPAKYVESNRFLEELGIPDGMTQNVITHYESMLNGYPVTFAESWLSTNNPKNFRKALTEEWGLDSNRADIAMELFRRVFKAGYNHVGVLNEMRRRHDELKKRKGDIEEGEGLLTNHF
jgi:hypothetical protein